MKTPSRKLHGKQNKLQSIPPEQIIPQNLSETEVWLDKQDLLELVHVSNRTLQRWRDTGLISFAKVHGKIYYRRSALQQLMHSMELLTMRERRQRFGRNNQE